MSFYGFNDRHRINNTVGKWHADLAIIPHQPGKNRKHASLIISWRGDAQTENRQLQTKSAWTLGLQQTGFMGIKKGVQWAPLWEGLPNMFRLSRIKESRWIFGKQNVSVVYLNSMNFSQEKHWRKSWSCNQSLKVKTFPPGTEKIAASIVTNVPKQQRSSSYSVQ